VLKQVLKATTHSSCLHFLKQDLHIITHMCPLGWFIVLFLTCYYWREASFNHCYIYNLKVNQMIHKMTITVALNHSHNNSCIIILYIANNQGQCNRCSLDRSHAAITTTSKTMITWPWLPLQTLLKVLITTIVKIQNEVP
jgi:hypothetical protein